MAKGYYSLSYCDLETGIAQEIPLREEYVYAIAQLLGLTPVDENGVRVDPIEVIQERVAKFASLDNWNI